MIYINESDVRNIGTDWEQIFTQIVQAVVCMDNEDFAQPIKPYLKYRDYSNRIIAMPAFIGGSFNVSGIKWIASFPDNILKNLPRAHSIVVLNNADTGEPIGIINTALLSIIRTVGVSGVVLKYFSKVRRLKNFNLGIIGWGPIGQYHFKMCTEVFGNDISDIFLYDLREINKESIDYPDKNRIHIADSWTEVYENADVFITCTVSKERYIDKKPKEGALLLNVSLRDFKTGIFDYVKDAIIVDDWDEVCRKNTDVEMMHLKKGLKKDDTRSIIDVVCKSCLNKYDDKQAIMFNPMGMAVFDITIGKYYFEKAKEKDTGVHLE